MPYLLEVPLSDGKAMLVEVTGQVEGVVPAAKGRDIVGKLPESLIAGLDRVRTFAGDVLDRLRSLPEAPDAITVEFGLKLTAKTGVVIAESSGEAHIKVSAEWRGPAAATSGAEVT